MPAGLGEFLRSRRERLTPEAVGLPLGRRRRTPGLRREEVAELAGIGVDWYVRLEQGRTVRPSAATIDALAAALRLDDTERAHLAVLARQTARPAFEPETVPPAVKRLIEGLDQPAYATGRRWDVLAWNDAAGELFTDFGACADEDRNILVYLLLDPATRRLFGKDWAAMARHTVTQFRAAHDVFAGDPMFTRLAARLAAGSPEFTAWWEDHDISVGRGSGRKVLHHPVRGVLTYDYATFQANDDAAVRLTVYAPAK
ncbi:helix-turn-helix transcriptional regulator [Kutzneria kofuensis]|uniref:Transcriptional regulator with XRE-family HTH domain n=1 Tax=Kutzneria kofuensis TaxID=103725 RepID=A0A7W9KPV8_9PSEU|nr:helix-turn-helix transcriptional regulator [Kutzneria kofuensis]MBB5896238.1 transcriptional regulator with XRE-family HTH domain [Kutzneria kofuensis]